VASNDILRNKTAGPKGLLFGQVFTIGEQCCTCCKPYTSSVTFVRRYNTFCAVVLNRKTTRISSRATCYGKPGCWQ
jgi:hypothetical protein